MRFSLIFCAVLLASIAPTVVAERTFAWDNIETVYALGDIHGAYPELVELLQGNGIINEDLKWQAGTAHVVSLGDMLDRGAESRRVIDLFMQLETQAQDAGGAFHVLLGNHELMNLSGDLRDVSDAEYASYGGLEGHRAAFALDGRYGRWLKTLPAIIRINRSVFLHGGLSPLLAGRSLKDINERLNSQLDVLLTEGATLKQHREVDLPIDGPIDLLNLPEQITASDALAALRDEPLFGPWGPLWYRGNASCHHLLEAQNIEGRLGDFSVNRIVIAHTPTASREITTRFDGAVTMIDTGMLNSVYRGNPRLLKVGPDKLYAMGPLGDAHPIRRATRPEPDLQTAEILSVEPGKAFSIVKFDDGTAHFIKLGKTARRRAVAAYRLDRLLGVNMVPTTAERQVDGRDGILLAQPSRVLSETERVERGIFRPNECYQTSDYDLLAAFDALIGMRTRGPDNLLYALPSWSITLAGTHESLGSSSTLPNYVTPPKLPQAFADAIAKINAETLESEFDALLKKGEIRALIKRRDAILGWVRSGTSGGE